MMLDVALMYLNIPKVSRGKAQPNPLLFPSSPPSDLPGLSNFVYDDGDDDEEDGSDGRGRLCLVDRAMTDGDSGGEVCELCVGLKTEERSSGEGK